MVPVLKGTESLFNLRLLSSIRTEILETKCTHVLQVFDPLPWKDVDPSSSIAGQTGPSNLIISLAVDQSLSNTTILLYSSTPRFVQICSLILYRNMEQFTQTEWPKFPFPGYPHHDYHVFINRLQTPDRNNEPRQLVHLGNLTRNIHHAFYMLHDGQSAKVFRRSSVDGHRFLAISHFSSSTEKQRSQDSLLQLAKYRADFQQGPLVMITCGACGEPFFNYFKRTGEWPERHIAAAYELSLAVNATIVFKAMSSAPRLERDSNGGWDDWLSPLVNGSAAIAAYQSYSDTGQKRLKDFHFAVPYRFESIIFITAQPKKLDQSGSSLGRLLSPLDFPVWLASCVSILMLSLALEVFIQLKQMGNVFRQRETTKFRNIWSHLALFKVLKLLLGQGANIPLKKATENIMQIRFLFSIWLLVIIVLGSGYQSFLSSHIVAPTFTRLPETFAELAESNYKVYAVLWKDQYRPHFESSNTKYGPKLAARAQDVNFLGPECYVAIHEGNNACIGTKGALTYHGVMYSVDVNGRLMYQQSKDSVFFVGLTFAISKHFPEIHERLDFIIMNFQSAGLPSRWTMHFLFYATVKGKAFAEEIKSTVEAYDGQEKFTNHSILPLLQNVMSIGFLAAVIIFVMELFKLSAVRGGDPVKNFTASVSRPIVSAIDK